MYPQISFFSVQIPSFFLVISISLTFLMLWLSLRLDSNATNPEQFFNRKIAFNLALLIMIFGFWGARLFHVFYEEWDFYYQYPIHIFKFWNGGFVYFGGFFAALLASIIYLKIHNQNFIKWADFATPLLSASYALGRIGCFLEGCCYGKYCELPWAVNQRHPTQLYMAFGEFFILGLMLLLERKKPFDGYLFFKWLLLHSLFRFSIEYFRDDERGASILEMSVSQSICVLIILICLAFFMQKTLKTKNIKN